MTDFAMQLAHRIRTTDEIIYLHCWGGHGRAGTVVCLLLHFLSPRRRLRELGKKNDDVPLRVGTTRTRPRR